MPADILLRRDRNGAIGALEPESAAVIHGMRSVHVVHRADPDDRASPVAMGRRRVRVATPDDLIVYKTIAARERDLSDVERLLETHGKIARAHRTLRRNRALAVQAATRVRPSIRSVPDLPIRQRIRDAGGSAPMRPS